MKQTKNIIILFFLLIPIFCFSQNFHNTLKISSGLTQAYFIDSNFPLYGNNISLGYSRSVNDYLNVRCSYDYLNRQIHYIRPVFSRSNNFQSYNRHYKQVTSHLISIGLEYKIIESRRFLSHLGLSYAQGFERKFSIEELSIFGTESARRIKTPFNEFPFHLIMDARVGYKIMNNLSIGLETRYIIHSGAELNYNVFIAVGF